MDPLGRRKKLLLIDKYAYTNKLANSSPTIKLITVVMSLVISTVISNNYINLMIFFMMVILTTIAAGIPLDKYLRILFIPMGFLFISILTILFSISGENIFIWSIKLGSKYIGMTDKSIVQSINIAIRVFASLSATFFLALTTPMNNLIKVFRKMKIPNTMIELCVLIYRCIFIFLEESKEVYVAQEMKFGYSSFKKSLNSTGLLIKALFIGVLLKYQDMVITLDCKLYDGEFKIGD